MLYLSRFGDELVVPKIPVQPPVRRKNVLLNKIMPADYTLLFKAIGFLLASATGFYYFEKEAWPDLSFGDSLWWSLVTAMTVGYGDIYPKTWQGRWLVAAPTILLGVGFLAYTFGVLQNDGRLQYVWRQITS